MKNRIVSVFLALIIAFVPSAFVFAAEQSETDALRGTTLYVYNWGEYISDGVDGSLNVNEAFEEKYGIEVVYETYDNNEVMYSKLKGGGVSYDIVIPSDYMIQRMIAEDMLQPLDFSNIPNYKYIPEKYKNLAHDPENLYSVPYTVGMVGLIYNTAMVEVPPTSWTSLWDKNYSNSILMFNNPRDAFAIAQSVLGMDYNNESPASWRVAAELLKEQKNVSPAYVNDEIFLKMESGEAALAPYYAGDFLSMQENNPDLAFVYPEEGVNFFVDGACVLKDAKNKLAAELYINFLLEPEIALANAEYICYASPHTEVYTNPEYSFYEDEILYPEDGKFKTQLFLNLNPDILALMSTLWDDVKNHVPSGTGNSLLFFGEDETAADNGEEMTPEAQKYALYIGIFALICLAYIVFRYARKKYRENV